METVGDGNREGTEEKIKRVQRQINQLGVMWNPNAVKTSWNL